MKKDEKRGEYLQNTLFFLVKVVFVLAVVVVLNGCLQVEATAPPGSEIVLAPPGAKCQKKVSKRVWFILWGITSLSDNSTVELLRDIKGPVKIVSKFTPLDVVIAFFTSAVSIVPKTVEIYTCTK